jgi:hypothetical protein
LFVSSNPSFNPREDFPTISWDDDRIEAFFTTRFDFSDQASHYWRVVEAIAKDLLGRSPRPGHDYALTEVVRCKSLGEKGARQALDECSGRYLARTLEIAGANVIVALGKLARNGVARHLRIPDSQIGLHERVILGDRECAVLMLGHPSGPERKKPTVEETTGLRKHL